jgi:hypothetical protein
VRKRETETETETSNASLVESIMYKMEIPIKNMSISIRTLDKPNYLLV